MLRLLRSMTIGLLLVGFGCGESGPYAEESVILVKNRPERRAYRGAPPVVPHPPLSGKCTSCHTPEGRTAPGIGQAPANPHLETPGMSERSRCRQCHVFKGTDEMFRPTRFAGLAVGAGEGERAHRFAPPTVPHRHFMREDCLACHAGPGARPAIRFDHPERSRCLQCHVLQETDAESFASSDVRKSPVGEGRSADR